MTWLPRFQSRERTVRAGRTADPDTVPGERSTSILHRSRSVQSRLGSLMAFALMAIVGVALLAWYYANAFTRPARIARNEKAIVARRAQDEMNLPSLGAVERPKIVQPSSEPVAPTVSAPQASQAPRPDLPAPPPQTALPLLEPAREAQSIVLSAGTPPTKSAAESILERKLAGPAFSRQSSFDGAPQPAPSPGVGDRDMKPAAQSSGSESAAGSLDRLLTVSSLKSAVASRLPTQRLLLAKGAFIDCTLETAIDSTLPGMTTCVTATDTFGADGTVVLLERGSKLIGETRGEVQQGSSRVFVVWTEARTPQGIVIPLQSPGTDSLGRAGLTGEVDRHFWGRFGAAILISVIDVGVQAGVRMSSGGTVVYSPSTSEGVATESLKGTLNIPPTIAVAQGSRIQILVARDLDFRSVYELHLGSDSR